MGRRLICQWWVMTSVKTVSEQQDSVRSSSSTTHSCVPEAWLARTLARVMEAVLWCPSKYDPNTYVQAGIVAWGIGCGENGTPGVYADVAKATCWIDQAISCHYGASSGDFSSYFGYTSNVCQTWYDNKISELNAKKDSAGSFGKIFEKMIGEYSKCYVNWEQPTAPLLDISSFERANDGYSEPQQEEVKAAPQQEQPY